MPKYRTVIDVVTTYTVDIDADSEDNAARIANDMQSTAVREQGYNDVTETLLISVDLAGEMLVSGDAIVVDPEFYKGEGEQ